MHLGGPASREADHLRELPRQWQCQRGQTYHRQRSGAGVSEAAVAADHAGVVQLPTQLHFNPSECVGELQLQAIGLLGGCNQNKRGFALLAQTQATHGCRGLASLACLRQQRRQRWVVRLTLVTPTTRGQGQCSQILGFGQGGAKMNQPGTTSAQVQHEASTAVV